jgi:hypothetical protein
VPRCFIGTIFAAIMNLGLLVYTTKNTKGTKKIGGVLHTGVIFFR